MLSRLVWKYSATSLCLSQDFSRPLDQQNMSFEQTLYNNITIYLYLYHIYIDFMLVSGVLIMFTILV